MKCFAHKMNPYAWKVNTCCEWLSSVVSLKGWELEQLIPVRLSLLSEEERAKKFTQTQMCCILALSQVSTKGTAYTFGDMPYAKSKLCQKENRIPPKEKNALQDPPPKVLIFHSA